VILAASDAYKESLDAYKRLLFITPDYQPTTRLSPKIMEPFTDAREFWKGKARPEVKHEMKGKLEGGKPLSMHIWVANDSLELVSGLRLNYRPQGGVYQPIGAAGRDSMVEIPGTAIQEESNIEYFVSALDKFGGVLLEAGKEDMPFRLSGQEGTEVAASSPWYTKWWIWTIVGVVVVGTTATILGVTLSGDDTVQYRVVIDTNQAAKP
jgi:hypothetical protein